MRYREELRRTREARVTAFRASGQNGPVWCAAEGVTVHPVRYWLHALKIVDAVASGPTWVAVSGSPPSGAVGLTIRVGAAAIAVEPGVNPDLLRTVVRALASCRAR